MDIREAIESSSTMAEAAKKLNLPFSTFKRRAGDLYKPNQGAKGTSKRYGGDKIPLEEILEGKHPQYQTAKVKKRYLEAGLLEEKCDWCGIENEWNGKPITLQLDHINGINSDHRLENVRMLCPNCHSQTDSYCGRNKGSVPLAK